ncbi:histidinol dehydrogenase [Virgibacillus kimchii]
MEMLTAKQFTNKSASAEETAVNQIDEQVTEIIGQVRKNGDRALYSYTEKFDGAKLDHLIVTENEFAEAEQKVKPSVIHALQKAKANIEEFHRQQVEKSWFFEKEKGVTLGQKITPMEKAGIYIPGGKAAYPSTVLMNVIPAKIAGVENIAITTPPQPDGSVNPYVLTAARIAGADTVYKLGGAQAIAALAYGTETVKKVSKITGPGNTFVARAKKWVFGDVDIDMIAGPSEICILADETTNAKYAAADLLSQAEHDESASSICVSTCRTTAENILKEVNRQSATLERRQIMEKSLAQNGKCVIAENIQEAYDVINELAPEHLQLMTNHPSDDLAFIKNAGAIFIGESSAEVLGDYYAGPNHTLPTNGTAKFSSPLGVYDFVKKSSIIHFSQEALMDAAEDIIQLAETEGLTAHANAIQVRKDDKNA